MFSSASKNLRHQPISYYEYKKIHNSYIDQLKKEQFIDNDTLVFDETKKERSVILLCGKLSCLGGIIITVNKVLKVEKPGYFKKLEKCLVHTISYSDNVSITQHGNIFRYEEQHRDHRENHPDKHHKHKFDVNTTNEIEVEWIGDQNWPTLGDVIQEAQNWYYDNRDWYDNNNYKLEGGEERISILNEYPDISSDVFGNRNNIEKILEGNEWFSQ